MPSIPVIEPDGDLRMKSARAAYANLARLNLYNTLSFIEDTIGLKDPSRKEDAITDMALFSLENSPENAEYRQQAFRLLCRHFGFVKFMNEEDEKRRKKGDGYIKSFDYSQAINVLRRVVDVLVYYRDQSTHYAFRDDRTTDRSFLSQEEFLAWELDTSFTIAIRIIKDRYEKEIKDKGQEKILDFLNGRTHKDKKTGKISLNYRHSFSLSTKDEDGNTRLSELGKVFLLSLFLQKQYSSELLDKCGIFEKRDRYGELYAPASSPQQSYVRDIFSALRVRLPHARIDSSRNIDQIGMDMLSELKRCPGELFDLLSAEDQNRFRMTSEDGGTVLQKRYSDRFPQLALSFIDYSGLFRSARFAVNVGCYRYVFQEKKHCIDGSTEPRILQKDINGFGRIQEIEAIRSSDSGVSANLWPFQHLIKGYEDTPRKDAECCPYIQDKRTRYLFNNDRIGICFGPRPEGYPVEYESPLHKDGSVIWYLPDIKEGHERHPEVFCLEPQCWLSVYDIPAMTFLAFLTKDREYQGLQPVEKLILDCIVRYRRLFRDISDGTVFSTGGMAIEKYIFDNYGIAFMDIPKSLRRFLINEGYDADKRFRSHLLRIVSGDLNIAFKGDGIKGQVECSSDMLDRWDSLKKAVTNFKENKPGKDGFEEIKTGQLMNWLLKDIVTLQKYTPVISEDGVIRSNKLTGLNYSKLQGLLSSFPFKTSGDLKKIFEEYGILDTHPFLRKAFTNYDDEQPVAPHPLALYKNYLEERYEFFLDLQEKINNGEPIENYGFVKAERRKWQRDYLETLPREFYDSKTGRFIPIFLPSGLFEKPLRERLDRIPELRDVLVSGDKDGRKANTTFMIQKYFEVVLGDGSQPFYSFVRTYPFHDYIDRKRKEIKIGAIQAVDKATGRALPTSNFREAVKAAVASRPLHDDSNRTTDKEKYATAPTPYSVETLRRKWKMMTNTERVLRRYKVQDMLLFLMGTSIVFPLDTQTRRQEHGLLLRNVLGGNEGEDILSQPVDILTTIRIRQKAYAIKQKGVKVRDYTDVFALLRDTRTCSLLPILPEGPVNADGLRDELKRYDQQRPGVFQDLLVFEKTQYKRNEHLLGEGKIDFKRLLGLGTNLSEEQKNELRAIRNAFSHNSYASPSTVDYTPVLRPSPEKGPAESLEQKANELVNRS